MTDSGIFGLSPVAKAFLDDGVGPLFPKRMHPLPRPGRRGLDAHGHTIVTAFFRLKGEQVTIGLQQEIYVLLGSWLKRFQVYETDGYGNMKSNPFGERALGPIRLLNRSYKWKNLVGTVAVTLIKNGRGGSTVLVTLTESKYFRPMPSQAERARYSKDWRKVHAYPWKYAKFK